MTREYQLTEEQHAKLMDASKPVPAMFLSGGRPMYESPREAAFRIWRELGKEMGFKWDTARAIPGKSDYFFTAEPNDE